MELQRVSHPFPALWNEDSRILILGSFPSVKSREQGFFYGHPQNRFWKVMAAVLQVPLPQTMEEKKRMLLDHGIALWDVIESCDIRGSSDSSIRNAVPTGLSGILQSSKIRRIYCNGKTSGALYEKYQQRELGMPCTVLPSTSPANAAWRMEMLIEEWKRQLDPVLGEAFGTDRSNRS